MLIDIAQVHGLTGNINNMVFILGVVSDTGELLENNIVVNVLLEEIHLDQGLFAVVGYIVAVIAGVAVNFITKLIHLLRGLGNIGIHDRRDGHGPGCELEVLHLGDGNGPDLVRVHAGNLLQLTADPLDLFKGILVKDIPLPDLDHDDDIVCATENISDFVVNFHEGVLLGKQVTKAGFNGKVGNFIKEKNGYQPDKHQKDCAFSDKKFCKSFQVISPLLKVNKLKKY